MSYDLKIGHCYDCRCLIDKPDTHVWSHGTLYCGDCFEKQRAHSEGVRSTAEYYRAHQDEPNVDYDDD